MLFRSDRKSTRLNSSHTIISYAVFCLKKKKSGTAVQAGVGTRTDRDLRKCPGARRWRSLPHHHSACHRAHHPNHCSLLFFFLKERGPPENIPFSPPPPFPI